MQLFTPPTHTRYDLNFNFLGFPVRVHPLFWLIAFILGFSTRNLVSATMWVIVVFVSILIHELGHALAMRYYGQPSRIILHGGGGLTVPEPTLWGSANVSFGSNSEIFISLAGPLAGFLTAIVILLGVVAVGGRVSISLLLGLIPLPDAQLPFGGLYANIFVGMLLWVNIFWGLINLMPIYPLDGGNITRHLMIKQDPWGGLRKSLWVSVIAGVLVALLGALLIRPLMVLMFGLLAFQSYQLLQGRF